MDRASIVARLDKWKDEYDQTHDVHVPAFVALVALVEEVATDAFNEGYDEGQYLPPVK